MKKLANTEVEGSLSNKFRRKRFILFGNLIHSLPKPAKILDLGGTINYWEKMHFVNIQGVHITILNQHEEKIDYRNFTSIIGDARDLSVFKNGEFDIILSNSVIEHVGDFNDQMKMANEITRVGKSYFVQTPNFYFPIEQHFYFPFFQMLPISLRIWLVMHFRLGFFSKIADKNKAGEVVSSVRLLRKNEIKILFPQANIIKEKFLSLTKSFIVISK